jgi:hypothetical protein
LPGKSSLARLLARARGVPNPLDAPRLSIQQILTWADQHYERTGSWPRRNSGPVQDAPGETWAKINNALVNGLRGLHGNSSLARLLAQHRGARNIHGLPPLEAALMVAWADAHKRRTGAWPNSKSGAIPEEPGQTWAAIEHALNHGGRGWPGGSSLIQFLVEHRGIRNLKHPPRLNLGSIRNWARKHYERTGCWPNRYSGPVPDAPGETWGAIDSALQSGGRGLPAGWTLSCLLADLRTEGQRRDRKP